MSTPTDTGKRADTPLTGSTFQATNTAENGRLGAIGGAVTEAAATVKGVAADAATRLPEVAATTRTAFEDANRQLRGGSDEMLTVGSALSIGLAGGLLLGGANRIVVAGALLPAAMMVLAMLDRSSRAPDAVERRPQGD